MFIAIENPNKGLETIGLNNVFPDYGGGVTPCDGTSATGIDEATIAVVLTGVDTTVSLTVDLTGCSTIFWGFFYALVLSTEGHFIFGKNFPILKCMQTTHKHS